MLQELLFYSTLFFFVSFFVTASSNMSTINHDSTLWCTVQHDGEWTWISKSLNYLPVFLSGWIPTKFTVDSSECGGTGAGVCTEPIDAVATVQAGIRVHRTFVDVDTLIGAGETTRAVANHLANVANRASTYPIRTRVGYTRIWKLHNRTGFKDKKEQNDCSWD